MIRAVTQMVYGREHKTLWSLARCLTSQPSTLSTLMCRCTPIQQSVAAHPSSRVSLHTHPAAPFLLLERQLRGGGVSCSTTILAPCSSRCTMPVLNLCSFRHIRSLRLHIVLPSSVILPSSNTSSPFACAAKLAVNIPDHADLHDLDPSSC